MRSPATRAVTALRRHSTRRHVVMRIDEHGVITWTTPAGQTRTVEPHDYRVDPAPRITSYDRSDDEDDTPPF